MAQEPTAPVPPGAPAAGAPPATGILRPLVDLIGAVQTSLRTKLLVGFLTGSCMLLVMAVLSLLVMGRMGQHVADLAVQEDKLDRARQMEYQVTAQSHYRAMAVLTHDDNYNAEIVTAKQIFATNLDAVQQESDPGLADFFAGVRATVVRYDASGDRVLAAYQAGNLDQALQIHLAEEHPISHILEANMRQLEAQDLADMQHARDAFNQDRQLLTMVVGGFSVLSVIAMIVVLVLLHRLVLRRLAHLHQRLEQIRETRDISIRFSDANPDELGGVARALNDALDALQSALVREEQLQQQVQALRIEIDQTKRERAVAAIVDSDSFRDIAERAQAMRERRLAKAAAAPA